MMMMMIMIVVIVVVVGNPISRFKYSCACWGDLGLIPRNIRKRHVGSKI